jgi:hypothetical protein
MTMKEMMHNRPMKLGETKAREEKELDREEVW